MWAAVLVVGMPAAWRNPTAGALVLCWVFSEGLYTLTGNGLAVQYFAYPDIFVLAVIMAKPEYCNLQPYRSTLHQLKCILLERSPSDRFIMLSYPVAWYFYVTDIQPYYQYYALWWLAIAQFLAAGWEPVSKFFRRHAETMNRPPADPGTLLVAYPGGGRFE
jgi:hypothetical protein